MATFGENLGLAFQITDDILDFEGTEEETGKPPGSDLKGKHLTLPLIQALRSAPPEEAERIEKAIEDDKWTEEWQPILSFIRSYGGIEYAREKAREYAQAAGDRLSHLSDSPAKEALLNLVSYSVRRRK